MTPVAVDIFHGDRVVGDRTGEPNGFVQTRAAGIRAVAHKATQGVSSHDPLYSARRRLAQDAGVELWGAYDFNTGDPVDQQVRNFFAVAEPDERTMCCLDFEDNTHSQMSIGMLLDYLELADSRLGRPLWVYSGNRIKELAPRLTEDQRKFLATHPLWLCEYGSQARIAGLPWSRYSMWQWSADGAGPQPHSVPGIAMNGVDLNVISGTFEQLQAEWTGAAVSLPVNTTPLLPATQPSRFQNIVATCFGGEGDTQASAYGGRVDPDKLGVALPSRFRSPPSVRVFRGGVSVVCPVVDVGPHSTDDQYWTSHQRPAAEAQKGNHAGIDMTPAVFAALGVGSHSPNFGEMLVDWEFAQ